MSLQWKKPESHKVVTVAPSTAPRVRKPRKLSSKQLPKVVAALRAKFGK